MNTKTSFSLLLFMLPLLLKAQTTPPYATDKISFELLLNADDVVREDYGEFTMKSQKEGQTYYKMVVTILNEDSDAINIRFGYDKDNPVSKITIKIFDAAGNLVKKVKKKEINDYSANGSSTDIDDNRIKHYKATHNSYPYTIEYTYQKKHTGMGLAFSPHWYFQSSSNSSIEHSKFVVKLPKGQEFDYKVMNIDIETVKESTDEWDIYTWEAQKLLATKTEDNMPIFTEVIPMLYTSLGEFQVEEFTGGMSTWEEYSTFIHKLFKDRDELPSELKAKIKTLTAGATTDIEKIEILYEFMQENMRYVSVQLGIGGWQPFEAEYVYRNKYGDCKALTNYMYAMLGEAGVETYPALIQRGELYYHVDEDFIAPRFNHVVLHIPSENYWLECTSTDYPPNYLGSSNENRNALLIKEKGGGLIKTPALNAEQNTETTKASIIFQAGGIVNIKSKTTSTGEKHEIFRAIHRHYSEKELREWFLEMTSIPSATLNTIKIEPNKEEPKSTFSYDVNSKRFGSKAGKRMFVPLNCLNIYTNVPKKKKNRHHPILLSENFIEIDTITIALPDGYQVESIPNEHQQLEQPYGKYDFQVIKAEGKVTIIRRLVLRQTELPAETYAEYRQFFKKIAKTDNMKMVLIKKKKE